MSSPTVIQPDLPQGWGAALGGQKQGWPKQFRLLVGAALLGSLALTSCGENQSRAEDSELRVDGPAAKGPTPTETGTSATTETEQPARPLTGAGRRYQVAVETAYFFDKPEQSTPNGRYLRRGDTFFGEGETNGFVKTAFVQPNGASGTAWLKVSELRRLSGTTPRASRPAPVPRPAAPAAAEPEYSRSPAPAPRASGVAGTQRAIVVVDRSYFYNSPDLGTPRRAFCQRGDKLRVLQSSGNAVYVTFTNWEKVTTTGWMRKNALQPLAP